MFTADPFPHLYGVPLGVDFPAALVAGLEDRLAGADPTDWARIRILVSTRRMQRRIVGILAEGPARLLPRVDLITDLAEDPAVADLPESVPPLRRRLELMRLVKALIAREPDLAPSAAAFDLAGSLSGLLSEMHGEGVTLADLRDLDVGALSEHWARSLAFLDIAGHVFDDPLQPDPEARQRRAVERAVAQWAEAPPDHALIIAGSTGSRGTTSTLMQAVAGLGRGAVVLPGIDRDLPDAVWDRLGREPTTEDHPQDRFARLMRDLGTDAAGIRPWSDACGPRARNRVISLALRPAPVTDQWLSECPGLPHLPDAMAGISLAEAPSSCMEALAIALALRRAAMEGRRAALITPDRSLARRVSTALDRWRIVPDDSAGRPLALSPPGRFLRHVCEMIGAYPSGEALLTLLKHPLCQSGSERGRHQLLAREFELWLRREGPPFIDEGTLAAWAATRTDPADAAWARWVTEAALGLSRLEGGPLGRLVEAHVAAAERLAGGQAASGPGGLWDEAAGQEARRLVESLLGEADAGGEVGLRDYCALIDALLVGVDVRDPVLPHPDIMIWGTIEARVQGADLVILGGLNDGTWPELPAPDPWLNRIMRKQAGLLLPERQIGLSAHDFQQAVAAPEVLLTRALRDDEAETVVSRWLNRLTNLLRGTAERDGPRALEEMQARGRAWLDLAQALESQVAPVPPAPRPAPRPPVEARPRQLSVTQVQTLIRDPYAVYARHVLGLRPLDPMRPSPDAMLRGTVIHDVLEAFLREDPDPASPEAAARLIALAGERMARSVPWPATRRLWLARLAGVADWFVREEAARRRDAEPVLIEGRGRFEVPGTGVTLTAKADRIDRMRDGRLVIYDYKTGTPPTAEMIATFDQQLLLEAMMAEAGAFEGLDPEEVGGVAHIALKLPPRTISHALRDPGASVHLDPQASLTGLTLLLRAYARASRGYPSRRAMHKRGAEGDYDHLARFGEWSDSDEPVPERVG